MIRDFGINKHLNIKFYKAFGLNLKNSPLILTEKQKRQSQKILKIKLSGKILKQKIKNRINFSIKNKTFKGIRHKQKYPARGQRTHTNAKTKKRWVLN